MGRLQLSTIAWRVPRQVAALPRLEPALIRQALRLLSPQGMRRTMRERFLPLPGPGGGCFCAVVDERAAQAALQAGMVPVARMDNDQLLHAMLQVAGRAVARDAALGLAQRWPHLSAKWRLTCHQKVLAILAANALALAFVLWPATALKGVLLLTGGLFLLLAGLRLAAAAHRLKRHDFPSLREEELPAYTLLVPLYREAKVLPQLLAALKRLDYPTDKLDIKLLLEEADEETRAALRGIDLPAHFEVLIVPDGAPRTKPRALNFGLAFARGELLTIYDAEDIPDPAQLKRAAAAFAALPDDVACLQAPLAWYNADESMCSRLLGIEYAAHFDVVMPYLAAMGLPLPLGGTSNHFRIDALRQAGGWDAHNVTEDADLGMRLARMGYTARVLADSCTWEEACTTWKSWRHQRARWIKGWLQTWLVHMRNPVRLKREAGWGGVFVLQAMMGAGVFAALAHPFFLLLVALGLMLPPTHAPGWLDALVCALSAVVLLAGYGAAAIAAWQGLKRRGLTQLAPYIALLPLYWLAISAAAWLALWDFVRRPHHWRKTQHGASRFLPLNNGRQKGRWRP